MTLKTTACTATLVLVSLEWALAAEDRNQDGQPIQEQPGLNAGAGSVSPEIVTDRPDITESGSVVPKGSLQAENGLTLTSDHGQRTVDLSETLLRWGWEAGPNCAWLYQITFMVLKVVPQPLVLETSR